MEVKLDKSEFAQTKTKQQAAIKNLRAHHGEQQAVFRNLTSTWKGAGGDAFRACVQEISTQTLMGIFMISSLNNKANTVLSSMEATDRNIANKISLNGG